MSIWNEIDIDRHVGSRIRARRIQLGYSQTAIADKLGLTFQQVQKYERGYNRVSASRLYDLTKILGVETEYFFEGFSDEDIPKNIEVWGPDLWELISVFNSLPENARIPLRRLLKSISSDLS